jgi:hypothetical protein
MRQHRSSIQFKVSRVRGIRQGTAGVRAVVVTMEIGGHDVVLAAKDAVRLEWAARLLGLAPDVSLFRPATLIATEKVVFDEEG